MKVNIHHFTATPEKPDYEDFRLLEGGYKLFNKELKEWQSKFQEPKYDWVLSEDQNVITVKKNHDAKVKIYEEHKQIFFGWEHTSGLGVDYFEKGGSIITLYGDGSILYEAEDIHLFIEIGDCIEVDELQLICKNKGIEL